MQNKYGDQLENFGLDPDSDKKQNFDPRTGTRDVPVPVRTGELGTKPFGYPVGTGCEALLVSDKLIGGIGTSRVEYSVGLDTTQSRLVPLVETDI